MKQFSIVLNVVLVIAVGFLYYLHFSACKKDSKCASPVRSANVAAGSSMCAGPVVVYVDIDSLNNNVKVIKDRSKEFEAEQKRIVAEYENAYRSLEGEKNEFLKRGSAITQQEAQIFQEKLIRGQREIEARKQEKGQALAERAAKTMEGLQHKMKEFINEYNQDKKYTYILATGSGLEYLYKDSALNITNDVVEKMNEKMSETSGK